MIDELAFSERLLEKNRERCPECGSLKDAWGFCMKCFQEARNKRNEELQDDATMFGQNFFLDILDWIELYMEPEDVFSESLLADWADRNGWVPGEEDAIVKVEEPTKSDVDAVYASAKQNVAKLRKATEEFGGKDSDNLITRVYAQMADALDNLADAVYGLVEEDEDETE
jgi:hypothetical protein